MIPAKGHLPRRYATEVRVDGRKRVVFIFSCSGCGDLAKKFASKNGRDTYAKENCPAVTR